jgi:hypothetical protein
MNEKKYFGSWSANNCSSYNSKYEFSNLKTARKEMRAIAMGNTFSGNSGSWNVETANGDLVASGVVHNYVLN